MTLIALIPTLKRQAQARRLALSLSRQTAKIDEVLIIDNGLELETSVEPLDSFVLKTIRPERRLSVGAAWNIGMEQLEKAERGSHLVVLNDDIELGEDAIDQMIECLGNAPECCIVGPRIHPFCCFLVSQDAVADVGHFDEQFFPAYFEDNDYRRRMKLAGWQEFAMDELMMGLKHVGSTTVSAMTSAEKAFMRRCYKNNQRLYEAKWGGPPHYELFSVPYDADSWRPK